MKFGRTGLKIHNEITELRFRSGPEPARLWPPRGRFRTRFSRPRARSDALCSSEARPRCARALSGAILLRFWVARTAPGAPRASIFLDFRAVFRGFSLRRGVRTKNVRHQQNTGRSGTKRTSELPRDRPKTSKIDPRALLRAFGGTNRPQERLRTSPGALPSDFGAPRGDPRALSELPGMPKKITGDLWGRPK